MFSSFSLSTYAIVAVILASLVYITYRSFVPQTKKSKSKKASTSSISSPVGIVTASGTGGYQEEWIPEHHLRKSKTSGESGAEGRKKTKK
jgi:hypothetical protein